MSGGFISRAAAEEWAKKRKASGVAQRSDHVTEVLDGEAGARVVSDGMSVLPHEGINDAAGGASVADVDLGDEEGDGHA